MTTALVPNDSHEITIGPFRLLKTGLAVIGEPTFEQWDKFGGFLSHAEGAVHWWIGDWLNYGERRWGEDHAQAVDQTGFSDDTIYHDKWVAEHVEVCRRRQTLSWSHHAQVAKLEPAEQDYWLDLAETNAWTRSELRSEMRRGLPQPDLPQGKYRVIYADPPWKYADILPEGYGAAEHHYKTLDIDELCALRIVDLAADDAVLFLWVTSPKLQECFQLIPAWGFIYKASFVWDKVRHNYGHYNSVRHEFLLVCTRGSCLPDSKELRDSVVSIERSDVHSQKPDAFREMIDALYPGGPRIELFARGQAPAGWEVWGDECRE